MLSRRQDQENVAHVQHDVVVGKERSLTGAAKSPARRTQKVLNDENKAVTAKGAKDKKQVQIFATPAASRTRAPLGAKTTNAKATAFLTPAHAAIKQTNQKQTITPRLRKSKIKVHDAEVAVVPDDESEEREIEYMPPREVPLTDLPDEDIWPHNRDYPQFEGENLTKGWAIAFFKSHDSDDEDFAAKIKRIELEEDRHSKDQGPATITSKSAASLLNKKSTPSSFAAETSSSRARKITPVVSNTRHVAAKVASNTTLGYSRGRAVSGVARKPTFTEIGKQTKSIHRALPELFAEMSDDERELVARAEEHEEAELKRMEADFFEDIDDL